MDTTYKKHRMKVKHKQSVAGSVGWRVSRSARVRLGRVGSGQFGSGWSVVYSRYVHFLTFPTIPRFLDQCHLYCWRQCLQNKMKTIKIKIFLLFYNNLKHHNGQKFSGFHCLKFSNGLKPNVNEVCVKKKIQKIKWQTEKRGGNTCPAVQS